MRQVFLDRFLSYLNGVFENDIEHYQQVAFHIVISLLESFHKSLSVSLLNDMSLEFWICFDDRVDEMDSSSAHFPAAINCIYSVKFFLIVTPAL